MQLDIMAKWTVPNESDKVDSLEYKNARSTVLNEKKANVAVLNEKLANSTVVIESSKSDIFQWKSCKLESFK